MTDIEKKAREYADEVLKQALLMYDKDASEFLAENAYHAYLQGTKEALANQWRSVVDEMPDDNRLVLCRMKSNDAIVRGYITMRWTGKTVVATAPDFHFEDDGGYECIHWMPIPELQTLNPKNK